jgi:hypothetical protein
MSPLQGLFEEHSLLEEGNEVVLGARAEEVVASWWVHTEADIYFATSMAVEELELGFSTEALYTEAAVAADVVGESQAEDEQVEAVGGNTKEVKKLLVP